MEAKIKVKRGKIAESNEKTLDYMNTIKKKSQNWTSLTDLMRSDKTGKGNGLPTDFGVSVGYIPERFVEAGYLESRIKNNVKEFCWNHTIKTLTIVDVYSLKKKQAYHTLNGILNKEFKRHMTSLVGEEGYSDELRNDDVYSKFKYNVFEFDKKILEITTKFDKQLEKAKSYVKIIDSNNNGVQSKIGFVEKKNNEEQNIRSKRYDHLNVRIELLIKTMFEQKAQIANLIKKIDDLTNENDETENEKT